MPRTASSIATSTKKVIAYVIVGGWCVFSVFLVLWVIMASLKSTRSLFGQPWTPPIKPAFSNYAKIWISNRFGDYFLNSFLVVSCSVILLLIVAVPAAYVLGSRTRGRGRRGSLI